MKIESYTDLVVWQRAMDAVVTVYELAARLPRYEQFGLASQMRRASVSIAANVAEGHARATSREYAQFISIARGSVKELETHLHICLRLRFLTARQVARVLAQTDEVSRMLAGLRASVLARGRKKRTPPSPLPPLP